MLVAPRHGADIQSMVVRRRSMMNRTTLAAIALSAAAFTACAPSQSAPQSGSGGGDGKSKYGGQVNVRIPVDMFDFDMSYVGKSAPNSYGQALAYDSLLGFKNGPDVPYASQIIEPKLAEKWEVSADARTYTFKLRSGVKFANLEPLNGRELTSADVKWSYEYASRQGQFKDKKLPQGQFDSMFEGVDKIEAPDPQTVVVTFKAPFVPFLTYAASDYNPVYPHEIYDQDGHLKDRMIGSGPFQLDPAGSQKGSRWVFKKNSTYWEPGKPYLDEVRWLVIPDDSTTMAAFQTKQIDFMNTEAFTYRAAQDLAKSAPQAIIKEYQQAVGWHIYLQVLQPPFNDARIRKAFAISLDRDELSQALSGTKGIWAPTGAMYGLFTDEEARQLLKYDPAEAKRLVAEAGYPNGIDITWEFPGRAYGDIYVTGIQLMQAQLKKGGINITLKSLDKDAFSAKRKQKDFSVHMVSSSCLGLKEEFETLLYGCYFSKAKGNYAGVNDADLDRLLNAQRAEVNPEKRRELLRDTVRKLSNEAYAVNTYYASQWQAWQPYLKNYAWSVAAAGVPLTNSWIDR
ncbi:MAG: ABC transporter substrate-binding protein [Dehalococcoidia bacterium]|nr:ABC transporter substrate-binding protein [Dehalococcoidia bacterium]